MPDGERTATPTDDESADPDQDAGAEPSQPEYAGGTMFSPYGIASAALCLLSVAAVVLGFLIWSAHRDEAAERVYLTRVMQAAADWANVLINMNSANIDGSLQRLHDGTVGELNTDFDAAVQPYRQVVQKLQSRSTGRIEAVAVESVHHDLDTRPDGGRPPRDVVTTALPQFATRMDSVLLVATSVSENAGGKPTTVHWNLRLDVSDVDGKLMVSGMASIR